MGDLLFVTLIVWAICMIIFMAALERTIQKGFDELKLQIDDCRKLLIEIKRSTENLRGVTEELVQIGQNETQHELYDLEDVVEEDNPDAEKQEEG